MCSLERLRLSIIRHAGAQDVQRQYEDFSHNQSRVKHSLLHARFRELWQHAVFDRLQERVFTLIRLTITW